MAAASSRATSRVRTPRFLSATISFLTPARILLAPDPYFCLKTDRLVAITLSSMVSPSAASVSSCSRVLFDQARGWLLRMPILSQSLNRVRILHHVSLGSCTGATVQAKPKPKPKHEACTICVSAADLLTYRTHDLRLAAFVFQLRSAL